MNCLVRGEATSLLKRSSDISRDFKRSRGVFVRKKEVTMKKAIYFLISALVAVSATGGSTAAFAQAAPIVMKLGTATINDSAHEWLKLFAAQIDKDSKGRIKVEVYPASQLGTSPRMIEQTQLGVIQG